jgi:hypothetical protein
LGEYGAGVGFDVAVPAGGRGFECLLGHDACAGVVVELVAVGEQRGPGRVRVCDEDRRLDAFVELERFGEPVFGVVVATREVVEEPEVVTDRWLDRGRRCDDLVVVWEQAFAQEWCSVGRSHACGGVGPIGEASAPREVVGHGEACGVVFVEHALGLVGVARTGVREGEYGAVGVEGWGVGERLFHEWDQLVQAPLMETDVREFDAVDREGVGFAVLRPEGERGLRKALIFGEVAAPTHCPGLMEGEVPADRGLRDTVCDLGRASQVRVDSGTIASFERRHPRHILLPVLQHGVTVLVSDVEYLVDPCGPQRKRRWMVDRRERSLNRELEQRRVTDTAGDRDRLFGECDPRGQVYLVQALGCGEREKFGALCGGRFADPFERTGRWRQCVRDRRRR